MKRAQTRGREYEHTQHLSILSSIAQLESKHAEPGERPFLLFSSFPPSLSPLFCLMMENFMCMTVVEADVYHFFFFLYTCVKNRLKKLFTIIIIII